MLVTYDTAHALLKWHFRSNPAEQLRVCNSSVCLLSMVGGRAVWYYKVPLGDASRSRKHAFAEFIEIVEGSPVAVRFTRPSTRQIEFEQVSTEDEMRALLREHFPMPVAEPVVKRARVA